MGRRLIVDTNILIAVERGRRDVLDLMDDDDELAVAAVTRAELEVGTELARDPETAATRARVVASILEAVEVLDYTSETASHHAHLLAHDRRSGPRRGAHDLIIAAHAVESRRAVLTLDGQARFGDLPGVRTA